MLGYNVFAADGDEEAEYLASSQQQAFVAIRTGQAIQLPPPVKGYRESIGAQGAAILSQVLSASAIGGARRSRARSPPSSSAPAPTS